MTFETFQKALQFAQRVEQTVKDIPGCNMILLSGGEPTEHPQIVEFIEAVRASGRRPLLLTNGMWLEDTGLRDRILSPEFPDLLVQVTNDPRFYPQQPPKVEDKRITYVGALRGLIPLGRFAGKTHPELPTKSAPSCFNLRSLTRGTGDFDRAVAMLRVKGLTGFSGMCTPSVSPDGSVVAGESRLCHKIGDVNTLSAVLTLNILRMGSCDRCGLESPLQGQFREAIFGRSDASA